MVDSWASNRQSTKVKLAPRFESPRNNQQPKNEVIEEKMDEDWGNPPPLGCTGRKSSEMHFYVSDFGPDNYRRWDLLITSPPERSLK